MKYAIPLGALLLLGIATGVHRATGESDRPKLRFERSVEVTSSPAAVDVRRDPKSDPAAAPVIVSKAITLETAQGRRKAEEIAWRKMSTTLGQSLSLTPPQQGRVEQVLQERLEEIRTCHAEIRRAQVIDVQQYEWQVARMKESWFKKIDALLDGKQHQQFVAIVEQGFFNEGLGFTLDPGMTVLD